MDTRPTRPEEKPTMGDLLRSIVRTFVPVVVGLILSALAQAGIDVDEGALTTVIDSVFIGGYYALVRVLESQSEAFGWFLGLPSAPSYDAHQ
jgi:hypothetical protein